MSLHQPPKIGAVGATGPAQPTTQTSALGSPPQTTSTPPVGGINTTDQVNVGPGDDEQGGGHSNIAGIGKLGGAAQAGNQPGFAPQFVSTTSGGHQATNQQASITARQPLYTSV